MIILTTGAAGYYFQGQVSAELTHEVHAELETVAELEATEVAQWLEENRRTTRLLSEFTIFRTGSPDDITAKLQRELDALPDEAQAIHYVNLETGTIEQSTNPGAEGTDLASLSLTWTHGSLDFQNAEVAVSDGYMRSGVERIAFVSRIPDTQRAIMLTVSTADLADHFRQPFQGTYTQVVDSEGTVEIAKNETDLLTTYDAGRDAEALQAALDGQSGALDRASTSEVVAYAPVEGTDWALLIHTPQSTAYVLRSQVTRDFVILIALALLGFVLIGLTLGRDTVTTLTRLEDTATSIAQGKLDVQTRRSDRLDEIGRVTNAFDEMHSYLSTAATQARAIADQEFDDPVLEENVPGEFGDALDQMRTDLEDLITRMEETNAELERKATAFGETMEQAASGDLTVRMDPESSNEAMTDIAEAFNETMEALETTIREISAFASDVDEAVNSVMVSAEEIETASEDVSTSIQEIASGTEQQEARLETVSSEMNDLSATIEEVASSADQVATVAADAAEASEAGSQSAAAAIEEMEAIETEAEETAREVRTLEEEIAQISEIVELITDIAEQTNMLALNASIEAASADGEGEGFAVVAEEIKSLAEEANEATADIEALIEEIQDSTSRTVRDMEEMSDQVADGTDTIEEALMALDEIVEHVEEANSGVQEINRATDEQADSIQEVVTMVEEVATVSDQTADEAETVSAASEEQTSTISEVTGRVQSLAEQSDELQSLLDEFEIQRTDTIGVEAGTGESAMTADGGQTSR